jgi:hypothetical protein
LAVVVGIGSAIMIIIIAIINYCDCYSCRHWRCCMLLTMVMLVHVGCGCGIVHHDAQLEIGVGVRISD